jgi:hypothetical protein
VDDRGIPDSSEQRELKLNPVQQMTARVGRIIRCGIFRGLDGEPRPDSMTDAAAETNKRDSSSGCAWLDADQVRPTMILTFTGGGDSYVMREIVSISQRRQCVEFAHC